MYESLPERERQLLRLVADGLADAQIAVRMGEPEENVAREVQHILSELGFRTRTHAIVYVLAREISASAQGGGSRPPIQHPSAEEPHAPGTEERPA